MTKRFALLLFLAACGGSTKSEPAAAPPAPAPAPAAATPVAAEKAEAADPNGKLSPAQCKQALDHAIELMEADPQAKQYADQMRAQFDALSAQCQQKGDQKGYDCIMASKSFAELGGCEQPEK